MPNSKHYEQQKGGDGTMDLYGHDFACTFRVPRESVLHVPAQRLNITRLVACKNFSTAVDESRGARLSDEQWCLSACKMGNRCKFVHVSRPLSEFPSQALHAHYIWRSVEDVTYDRLWTVEKDGGGTDGRARLTLHPCALCATQVNMCFNMLGDSNKTSVEGLLPPPITRPAPKATTTTNTAVVISDGAAVVEGGVVGDTEAATATVVAPPPRPPVDPETRALHDGLMLDVVAATLSTIEVPVSRFLKTFGATRALNSIRGEQQEGAATQQQQHHLQTCYEFACDNECKKGPDCDRAHVINVDPTLEVPFVRRSMRHVKAAVSSMHRGPPHGELKPAPHIVAKLLKDEFLISKEDVELVSEAGRADPTTYSQPAPPTADTQPNPYRLPKAHPLRTNAKGQTSTGQPVGKVPRGEAPQYAPYPSPVFMSPNPLQALIAGNCDFVVSQGPQHYNNNGNAVMGHPGARYTNTPENSSSGQHHHVASLPTYPNNSTNSTAAPANTTPAPHQMGMCIQYPQYMIADPAAAPTATSPDQNQDRAHDCQMARLVDDVIGPPRRHQSQPIFRSIANSNNNSSSTVGDTIVIGGIRSQQHNPQQQQPPTWSPFNASLNWQQQHYVPQLAQQHASSSTSQGSSNSSNNMLMMHHHQQQQGYMTATSGPQQHYTIGHNQVSTHHHQMPMPPLPPPHQQQQHQAMMYSMPYPFNSGGQLQFVTPTHTSTTNPTTTQAPLPFALMSGYHHTPTQLGQQ